MTRPTDFLRRAGRSLLRTLWGPDPGYAPATVSRSWWGPFVVPVGLLAIVGLATITAKAYGDQRGMPVVIGWPLAILVTSPLLLVRTRPLWAWRLTAVGLILGVADAPPTTDWPWIASQILIAIVVLYAVALREPIGVIAWATFFTCLIMWALCPRDISASATFVLVALVVLGEQVQRRRRTQERLRAEQERSDLAEARRALLEERARIARELHDVVAHSMSLLAVRAETAPYRLTDLPDPAREEFLAVASTARQTLAELRRLLGVLRTGPAEPELAPQPGLADLAVLIDTARTAGMSIDATLPRGSAVVPAATGLAAYRIVQEALSNAARHAPGTPVRVAVEADDVEVHVVVRNEARPGAATPSGGAGHGLRGMRERAFVLGGMLRAEPDPDGGFTVEASLPCGEPGRTE
ncbi:MAG: sensor histidine kinase [Hamadaea sp.]|nr:sensor histidine kinase [Hamadaea sp.]